jgi:hypothetical protein
MSTESEIKIAIKAYIDEKGSAYSNWYAGITDDAKRRLFEEHGVSEKNGLWIYRSADNDTIARRIEEYLIKLGLDGDTGGGDESSNVVYAYKKTSMTEP